MGELARAYNEQGSLRGPASDPARPTVTGTLEQAMHLLGEAEMTAMVIGGALLGPSPEANQKAPMPVGVVGAASEVRNRAQRLVELLHAIQRELA